MVEIWLPYGASEIPARIPEERLINILKAHEDGTVSDPAAELKLMIDANRNLLDAAKRAERICVVLGPSSNAQLSSSSAKILVESLIALGASSSSIALLRTGDGPALDPTFFGDLELITHDPVSLATAAIDDPKIDFPLSLNSLFINSDFRIILGELKPHHFLGYCGLSDLIFPGLASRSSVQSHLSNRQNMAVSDLHKERVDIANSFKNLFTIGFVLNGDLSPARISLGSFHDCLEDLEKAAQSVCLSRIDRAADVVVMSAGGRPVDESLLSAVETLPAAFPALKTDGVMIVAAECPSGHGNTEFYQWCAEHKEPRYLEARLKHNFNYRGFMAAFLLRTIEKHRVYLVSTIPDHYVENVFGMRSATTVNSALQTVQRSIGSSSTISVIPDASRIIAAQKEPMEPK
jgi:nickel-dependent lactate racemase